MLCLWLWTEAIQPYSIMRSAKAGIFSSKMGFTTAILRIASKRLLTLSDCVAKAQRILFLPRPGFGGLNLILSSLGISAREQRCLRRLQNSKSINSVRLKNEEVSL